MQTSDKQFINVHRLVKLGWMITNHYGDGVINLSKSHSGQEVMVFVSPDGTVKRPRTVGTMQADGELSSAGFTF